MKIDKLNFSYKPTIQELSEYVNSTTWNKWLAYIEATYPTTASIEYSNCSIPGWNLKYRKGNKSICTLYPMEGYFQCLIVINDRQADVVEQQLHSFDSYTQSLYHRTKHGMGQRWLLFEIEDQYMLKDLKKLAHIRSSI